jgi:hypothetical protein
MRDQGQGKSETNARTHPGWFRVAYVVLAVELVALFVVVARPHSATQKPVRPSALAVATPAQGPTAPPMSGRRPAPTTTVPPAPPTTVAPAPTTTVPPVHVTAPPPPTPRATVPPPPPPVHTAPASGSHVILPPAEPAVSTPPSPNFLLSCSPRTYDDSSGCVGAALAAIDNGRRAEGLGGMSVPSNWGSLTSQEQLFVATNLERTVRGLPALSAMATLLDTAAAVGADTGDDPSPPGGFPFFRWGANWAGGVGNPLEAIYYWMYDDGPGSNNADCPTGGGAGCWGHRNVILLSLPCAPCVMGTGFDPTGWGGQPSWAEILVGTSGSPATVFTWQQEAPYLG